MSYLNQDEERLFVAKKYMERGHFIEENDNFTFVSCKQQVGRTNLPRLG